MDLIPFSDRIWYLPGEQYTDRPFLYYLRGDRFSAMIDAGNSNAHVEKLYRNLKANGLPLPEYTIITHWHWDHTFALPYIHGISIASELTNRKLQEVMEWKWTEAAMKAREQSGKDIEFCNTCIRREYADLFAIRVCQADRSISAEKTLDLGGLTLCLIPRDSTHSRDALFVYVPEEGALFVGDADCKDYYDNHGLYDRKRLEELLVFLESLEYQHHFPGHDVPYTKSEIMAELKEELRLLCK